MRDCDVMVERINCGNMHGAGGQKTGDKINIPMGLARRRDIESKLCNNLICSGDKSVLLFHHHRHRRRRRRRHQAERGSNLT